MRMLSLMFGLFALPLAGQLQVAHRYPITQHQIATSVRLAGVSVADEAVVLPAGITSSEPDPALDVQTVLAPQAGTSEGLVRVKLTCRSAGACVPFFATVRGAVSPSAWDGVASGKAAMPQPAAPSIRAGNPAIMIIATKSMQIEVPVISLESGAIGSSIRVASWDRKQKYMATVISPTVLRGGL
jgi:hypothetical protein